MPYAERSPGLKHKPDHVFEEPGCAHNRAKPDKERKQGCSLPMTPGAAAGGCCFDGAKVTLQPITDAAHLVHGPLACEANSWDGRNVFSSGPSLYRTSFTTAMSEIDIIHGGEKKLYRAIGKIVAERAPAAVFVYQTCIPALTGEEVEAVCEFAAGKLDTPVIPVLAPGFVGSKNMGNKLAGEALLERVVGTEEPNDVTPFDVNIIGEYNVAGELWQVKPLLDALGIRIRACITGDSRYRDIATAHRARAAMVVRSEEHTSELQSHSFISYAVFCLTIKTTLFSLFPTSSTPLHPPPARRPPRLAGRGWLLSAGRVLASLENLTRPDSTQPFSPGSHRRTLIFRHVPFSSWGQPQTVIGGPFPSPPLQGVFRQALSVLVWLFRMVGRASRGKAGQPEKG